MRIQSVHCKSLWKYKLWLLIIIYSSFTELLWKAGNPEPGKFVSLTNHSVLFTIRKNSQWGFYEEWFLGDGSEVDIDYLVFVFDSLTAETKVLKSFALSNTAYNI